MKAESHCELKDIVKAEQFIATWDDPADNNDSWLGKFYSEHGDGKSRPGRKDERNGVIQVWLRDIADCLRQD